MTLTDDQVSEISRICKKHRVKELYLFGSALHANCRPDSDIDLAVVFSRTGIDGSFDQYFNFKFALEQLLDRPVDLVCRLLLEKKKKKKEDDEKKKII